MSRGEIEHAVVEGRGLYSAESRERDLLPPRRREGTRMIRRLRTSAAAVLSRTTLLARGEGMAGTRQLFTERNRWARPALWGEDLFPGNASERPVIRPRSLSPAARRETLENFWRKSGLQ